MTRKEAIAILENPESTEEQVEEAHAFFYEWAANHTQGGLEY